ncbi:Fc.00g046520.m01.CDS01 [Cosmosporella sp. VM-42]
MSNSKGSRSRDGCFNCRRRKRRCDEEKPVCLSCRRTGAECVFPAPRSASTPLKFIVAASPNHYMVPINQSSKRASFLNITSHELATICPKFEGTDANVLRHDLDESLDGLQWNQRGGSDDRILRVVSPFSFSQSPEALQEVETALIQYYAEVISSSRVYVQTGRNLFRTSVMPRVLYEKGPLLSTVLAMSAAEWGQNVVLSGRDYRALSTRYKVRALEELQRCLCATENAEENLLTCVLLASLEIAEGSRPTWLRHLQGATALLDNFATSIDPAVTNFALQYFRFRYILLKTTEPKGLTEVPPSDGHEASYDHAMDRLAETESALPFMHDSEGVIDEHLGCSVKLVDIINQISALSLATNDETELSRDPLYTEGQHLEHRLMQTKCWTAGDAPDEYLTKSAECFRIAAQIYLRLVCYDASITHPSVLEPHRRLLACLSDIIIEGQTRRLFPMWPLFIAGCTCSSDEQRKAVLNHFTTLDSQWPISNIAAVWKAVRTIWQARDLASPQTSSKQQDWQEIIHKFGWKLSLS